MEGWKGNIKKVGGKKMLISIEYFQAVFCLANECTKDDRD